MRLQLLYWLERLQASYWMIPAIMALAGMLLVPAQYLVHGLMPDALLQLDFFRHMQTMSTATARGILATVAGAAIGTASVVFSVSIVVLSLTASQFGPRLLKNFLRQGIAQLTLGTFIATFMFSLFGLTLLEGSLNGEAIAYLLVTVAILLGAGSFFVLIFYIHHIATFIQAPRVIDDVSRALMARLKMLPEAGADGAADDHPEQPDVRDRNAGQEHPLSTPRSGYIQTIDLDRLLQLAVEHDMRLRLEVYPGQFVLIGQCVAAIHSSKALDETPRAELLAAFTIGNERTATQDINYALDQMVEIAVRALSPGINDPYTAINCIDQLAAGLSLLAERRLPPSRLFDEQGVLRISKPHLRYIDILDAAFEQIREHGRRDLAVSRHLLDSLLKLHDLALPDDYREAVKTHLRILDGQFRASDANKLLTERYRKKLAQILD